MQQVCTVPEQLQNQSEARKELLYYEALYKCLQLTQVSLCCYLQDLMLKSEVVIPDLHPHTVTILKYFPIFIHIFQLNCPFTLKLNCIIILNIFSTTGCVLYEHVNLFLICVCQKQCQIFSYQYNYYYQSTVTVLNKNKVTVWSTTSGLNTV